jgi:hypothetical protein
MKVYKELLTNFVAVTTPFLPPVPPPPRCYIVLTMKCKQMECQVFGFVLVYSSRVNNMPFRTYIKERQFLELCSAPQREEIIKT